MVMCVMMATSEHVPSAYLYGIATVKRRRLLVFFVHLAVPATPSHAEIDGGLYYPVNGGRRGRAGWSPG
jgi:hypothetical protein